MASLPGDPGARVLPSRWIGRLWLIDLGGDALASVPVSGRSRINPSDRWDEDAEKLRERLSQQDQVKRPLSRNARLHQRPVATPPDAFGSPGAAPRGARHGRLWRRLARAAGRPPPERGRRHARAPRPRLGSPSRRGVPGHRGRQGGISALIAGRSRGPGACAATSAPTPHPMQRAPASADDRSASSVVPPPEQQIRTEHAAQMGEMGAARLRPDDAVGQLDQPVHPDGQPGGHWNGWGQQRSRSASGRAWRRPRSTEDASGRHRSSDACGPAT